MIGVQCGVWETLLVIDVRLDCFAAGPVTIADQTAEGAMISIISENLPSHAM